MKSAPIAQLKARLSEYLARVRGGERVNVTDRRAAALCIEQFCRAYPGARVLVTSRAEAYDQGRLDGTFTRYRLDAFGSAEADTQQAVVMRYPLFRRRTGGQLQGPLAFGHAPPPRTNATARRWIRSRRTTNPAPSLT